MNKRKTVKKKKTTPRFTLADLKPMTGLLTAIAIVILLILVSTGKLKLQKINIGGAEWEFSQPSPAVLLQETPVPADGDYAAQLFTEAHEKWPLVAKDSFDSNKLEWPEGSSEGEFVDATRMIADGRYSLRVKANSDTVGFKASPQKVVIVPNFYDAVDIKYMNRLDNVGYGLTFRDQGALNYYVFRIQPNQHFGIGYSDRGNNASGNLVDRNSDYILPFDTNRIAVIGKGSDFWFYINDVFVFHRQMHRFSTGSAGIAVTVGKADDEVLVEFDNFELRKAP